MFQNSIIEASFLRPKFGKLSIFQDYLLELSILEEKKVRRAGLDYHDLARVTRHKDYPAFLQYLNENRQGFRLFACTTKASGHHVDAQFQQGDVLLFGPETRGLPEDIIDSLPAEQRLRIPMMPDARSLNLSNAVAIIAFEAWRQMGFQGAT